MSCKPNPGGGASDRNGHEGPVRIRIEVGAVQDGQAAAGVDADQRAVHGERSPVHE